MRSDQAGRAREARFSARRSFRCLAHDLGDYPVSLSQATGSAEALALEHRDRCVIEEGCGDRSVFSVFGVAFYRSAAETGDLPQSAPKGGGCDSFAPIFPVDKEACDSPVGKARETLEISSLEFYARKLVGRPELAPAYARRAFVYESGVSLALPN